MARGPDTQYNGPELEGSVENFPLALREVNRRIQSALKAGTKKTRNAASIVALPQLALQKSTSISQVGTVPNAIRELLEDGGCLEKAAIFSLARLAYYIIDGKLYLWEFQANLCHKVALARPVEAVDLVKPKADIFRANMKYLLVVAGAGFVTMLGVSLAPNENLILHQINQEAAVEEDSKITSVVGTELGRIFLGSTSGDIFEIIYQENLNRIKGLRVINCSKTFFVRVKDLFGFLKSPDESIKSLVMDHQRAALYALTCNSSIKVISLGEDGLSFGMIQTWTPSPRQTIVELQVIPRDDISYTRLIAVTSTGACLELRSSKPGDLLRAIGLECACIRSSLFAAHSSVTSAYSRGAILISGASGQAHFGIQFSESSSKVRSLSQYAVWQTEIEPLAAMSCSTGEKLGLVTELDDVYSQYHLPPRRFDVLTKDGLWEIKKLRPVDQLLQILKSIDSPWILFKPFIERYGTTEVCAMGLAILSKLPLAVMLIDSPVVADRSDSISSPVALDDIIVKRIIAMFNEINIRSPESESVISPFVSGAVTLTAHILAPVWSTPLFRNKICNANVRELAVLPKLLTRVHFGITSLLSTLESPPVDAFGFEGDLKLLSQLRFFLATVSHCLGFLLMLLESNLGVHLENLPSEFWTHAGSCTLAALISKSKPILVELAVLVIKHESSVWTPSKSIAVRAGEACKQYVMPSDVNLFKGLELMMAAQSNPIFSESARLLNETLNWFVLALPAISLSRLSDIVLDYCRFSKPKDALQLISKCVPIFNIPPSGSHDSVEFSALGELLQAPLGALKVQSPALLDDAVACVLSQTQEPNFHHGVYKWVFEWADPSSLYKVNTPFLEDYLRREFTAKNTIRLHDYFISKKKYTQAAVALFDFATSNEVDFSLKDRLDYLQKAQTIVTSLDTVDGSEARAKYRTRIEKALKDVEFQFRVLSEINYIGGVEGGEQFRTRLAPYPKLTEFISSHDSLKVCRLIVLQDLSIVDKPSRVKEIWANIIVSENQTRGGSTKSLTYPERLRTRIIDISRMVPVDSEVFPLDEVCKQLLQLTLSLSDQIPPEWAASVLLECEACPKRLVNVLELILITKVHPGDSLAFLRIAFLALSQALRALKKSFPLELR
ncbi:hypothetical protein DSO57_1030686 [Entomophthora muscae]|uniref:Uncharacterized protein n=1 Tax=Entomophthora muscae TaxID=34485 RepID=A0ACC2RS18_9FUNG|nr:hypothetical protein DSO57_1030686 [Entomophthora muscae]